MERTITIDINLKELNLQELYEVIESETLSDCIHDALTISGSLILKTRFNNVSFRNCVFFGSRMDQCEFVGCNFDNCTFQFTHINKSYFKGTRFSNCNWQHSTTKQNKLSCCDLDIKTLYLTGKEANELDDCFAGHAPIAA